MPTPLGCEAPTTRKRILIVDDDEDIGLLYGTILEGAGYSVSRTSSGKHGLKAIREGGFDLAILDLGIPDVDGFDILRGIRTLAARPKILAISGAIPNMLVAAKALGADLVLNKCQAKDLLIDSVHKVIGP